MALKDVGLCSARLEVFGPLGSPSVPKTEAADVCNPRTPPATVFLDDDDFMGGEYGLLDDNPPQDQQVRTRVCTPHFTRLPRRVEIENAPEKNVTQEKLERVGAAGARGRAAAVRHLRGHGVCGRRLCGGQSRLAGLQSAPILAVAGRFPGRRTPRSASRHPRSTAC